ncbi:MAG TPA: response regulator transcription factor [Flavobacterium sp.]|nr:response regulator transcription factor [Flavobacterium sp.]
MTTRLKCLLLDDELPGLTYLKMICEEIPELEVVKAFDNPEKLLAEIAFLDFDLVISDIEMPGIDGLTLAKLLQNKLVIFTTAYKEYAVDAFDIDAVDYLTKPVKKERLQKAVEKAVERFNKADTSKKFTSVNTDKGKALLYFDKIILVRTANSDSRDKEVLLNDQTQLLLKNINFDTLSNEFPGAHFCRINKKEIIAMNAVKFFSHDEITLQLSDKNGKFIVVNLSETYRPEFLAKIRI